MWKLRLDAFCPMTCSSVLLLQQVLYHIVPLNVCLIYYEDALLFGVTQVLWSRLVMVVAHAATGTLLMFRARSTDLNNSKSVYGCYMLIWKLFYCQYIFIGLLR